jgi:hypothetical protein
MKTRVKNDMADGKLAAKEIKEIMDAIRLIRARLPFLVALAAAHKRSLARGSDEMIAECMTIADVAAQEPSEFPASLCDPAKMRSDKALLDALTPIHAELERLVADLADHILALRSDILRHGLAGYTLIQRLAPHRPDLLKSIDKLAAIVSRNKAT